MTEFGLYPLNDFAVKVRFNRIDPSSGARTALTTGVASAFLAISDAPTALPADETLQMTPTRIGSTVWWLVFFDAAVLTPALLSSLFGSTPPYLIVQHADGIRVAKQLTYAPTKYGA